MKKIIPLVLLSLGLLFFGFKNHDSKEHVVVLVKYKTQPDKSNEALSHLKKLIEEVKKEKNFIEIKIHVDPNDNTNILLYEEWANESYYKNEHMKTQHLQQFITDSRTFLAGPPEISFWKVNTEYK